MKFSERRSRVSESEAQLVWGTASLESRPLRRHIFRKTQMSNRPLIAVTAGDVAGIGPEIVVQAFKNRAVQDACQSVVICNPDVLQKAVQLWGLEDELNVVHLPTIPQTRADLQHAFAKTVVNRGTLLCLNPAGNAAAAAPTGTVSPAAGDAAFQYLTLAIELAKANIFDAIATAPLNKAALHAAGHHFPGHTEILADRCGVTDFAMMLHLPESRIAPLRQLVRTANESDWPAHFGLSIAHVTLHTSIASVPQLLTTESIAEKIGLMDQFLKTIGCERRSIGVCALNPHGGEDGLFGDEEARLIQPAVQRFARTPDISVTGPLPVDTLIRRSVAGEFDGVIAMYHDQGHIPVKLIGFDSAVNITLGLPIVRTSPTHGTAFDRAWNPATPADAAGMIEAILTAAQLTN